jgi:hypothetical protein
MFSPATHLPLFSARICPAGLFKIFDEILVNAADNKVRDPTMDILKVDILPVSLRMTVAGEGGMVGWLDGCTLPLPACPDLSGVRPALLLVAGGWLNGWMIVLQ